MNSFVRITRHPYEEPHHVNLIIQASNGRQTGELEVYSIAEDLAVVGNGLRDFVQTSDGNAVLWQLGSERPEENFAFYFRLRVFPLGATGHLSAVELRFNNNRTPPEREVVEFSIEARPEALDRLANLFVQFSRLQDLVLHWEPA